MPAWLQVPACRHLVLRNVNVPAACIVGGPEPDALHLCIDGLVLVDIEILDGTVAAIDACSSTSSPTTGDATEVDAQQGMALPCFTDMHTHIDKAQTGQRSRNPDGTLTGADRSTAADADFWSAEDVYRRMEFSIRCAYAHGTSALRTHLINMAPKQIELTWPAFSALRKKWAGKVELQGVSLVVLSVFRDADKARQLADLVQRHGGIMGAAVCCAENGGSPYDEWTTCDRDRDQLLDRVFSLAKKRDLDLDFHVDENGNELATGLLHVAQKTIQHGYQGRVVCGHCCSLAFQKPEALARTLATVKEARITVVSLPMVNLWTQERDPRGRRTPRWRGITLLHELRAAGIPTSLASDNARDQFYAYGDLDMLEVFNQGCRIGHLDRPYGEWPTAVTSVPADAMHLRDHSRLAVGGPANLVLFRGRGFSELLSRPQYDRIVLRDGIPIHAEVPDYRELDEVPAKPQNVPVQRQPTSCAQNLYNTQANGAQCNGAQCDGTSQSKPADHVRIQARV